MYHPTDRRHILTANCQKVFQICGAADITLEHRDMGSLVPEQRHHLPGFLLVQSARRGEDEILGTIFEHPKSRCPPDPSKAADEKIRGVGSQERCMCTGSHERWSSTNTCLPMCLPACMVRRAFSSSETPNNVIGQGALIDPGSEHECPTASHKSTRTEFDTRQGNRGNGPKRAPVQ